MTLEDLVNLNIPKEKCISKTYVEVVILWNIREENFCCTAALFGRYMDSYLQYLYTCRQ
ncbi:hypothetical protein PORCAN_386 [Porphyromonas crevioricanis JCM 13913]|nr:hypothetical protein PORCAN_386 [Porphyromonas crevioricanis JCM 13913]